MILSLSGKYVYDTYCIMYMSCWQRLGTYNSCLWHVLLDYIFLRLVLMQLIAYRLL